MHDVKVCRCNGDGPELVYLEGLADPYRVTYFDADREAMDETNWDVIVDELSALAEDGEDPRYVIVDDMHKVPVFGQGAIEWQGPRWLADTPAWVQGHDSWTKDACHRCVHVRADDEDAVGVLRDIVGRLESYPLLDEDAYSALEHEAWNEWWNDDGFRDFIADALDIGYGDASDLLDELGDELSADLSERVQRSMHYTEGFSGEYSVEPAREALAAWTRELTWLVAEDARTMGGAQVVLVDVAPTI